MPLSNASENASEVSKEPNMNIDPNIFYREDGTLVFCDF